MQRRIYLASKNDDKKKVRDLQRQLVRSYSAIVQTVHRVTVINKEKITPCIDGFKATNDEKRGVLFDIILNENIKNHRPKPAYRTYIPKKNGKIRSLGIPTIKDRVYQEIRRMALEPEWEAKFEPISYGFRPERRQHDTIGNTFCHDGFKETIIFCFIKMFRSSHMEITSYLSRMKSTTALSIRDSNSQLS